MEPGAHTGRAGVVCRYLAAIWGQRIGGRLCFYQIFCYNAANGFEVSTAGVDTSKICRNPITLDPPRLEALVVPPTAAILQILRGKTVSELHRERSSALPDVDFVLRTALAELGTERLYTAFRPEITTQLEQLRTGETLHPFYRCEPDDMGGITFTMFLIRSGRSALSSGKERIRRLAHPYAVYIGH